MRRRLINSLLAGLVVLTARPDRPVAEAWAQSASDSASAQVVRLIERIEALPRFSKEALEEVLGVPLKLKESRTGWTFWGTSLPDGALADIDFSEPGREASVQAWRIAIDIREGVAVATRAIPRKYVGRPMHGATDGSLESIQTLSVDRPGALVHLQVGVTSDAVRGVVFVREQSPDRAQTEARFARVSRQAADLTAVIGKIKQLPVFSRSACQALFGVVLLPSSGRPPDVHSWEASLREGVIERVRYREVAPGTSTATWVLSVDLRKDVSIPWRFMDPDLITTRSGYRVRPDFDRTDVLRALTFTREGSPGRPRSPQ